VEGHILSTTGDALRCSTSKQDERLVEKHLEKFPSVLATFCLHNTGRNFQECLEDMSPRGKFSSAKGARHFEKWNACSGRFFLILK
jgi:hypothetical protein